MHLCLAAPDWLNLPCHHFPSGSSIWICSTPLFKRTMRHSCLCLLVMSLPQHILPVFYLGVRVSPRQNMKNLNQNSATIREMQQHSNSTLNDSLIGEVHRQQSISTVEFPFHIWFGHTVNSGDNSSTVNTRVTMTFTPVLTPWISESKAN